VRIIKSILIAFSMYSRIPVPQFKWEEEEYSHAISFLPLIGMVIGGLEIGLWFLCCLFDVPLFVTSLLLCLVPVVITGGFHLDGYMDVCDAISSYSGRERSLEIMKDPHIGAFAVIRLAICGLIYIASLIIVLGSDAAPGLIPGIAAGFMLSRCLSAQSVLSFKSAKKEGMLYYEATAAAGGRKVNITIVSIIAVTALWLMAFFAWTAGTLMMIAVLLSFIWYKHISYKEFGGITGDTAGYFVVVCETAIAAAAALATVVLPV
jgi:adenosylcobinamide-GDP ribazoletransferase